MALTNAKIANEAHRIGRAGQSVLNTQLRQLHVLIQHGMPKHLGTSHQGICSKIKEIPFGSRSCLQYAICQAVPLVFYAFMEIELVVVVVVVVLCDDTVFHDGWSTHTLEV